MTAYKTDVSFGERSGAGVYRSRPGAYLVCVRNGLAAVISTPKGYFLLGGGIKPDEAHDLCIKREILEEIGFSADIGEYIGSAQTFFTKSKNGELFNPVQFYYAGTLLKQTAFPLEEGNVLTWISLDGIEQKMRHPMQAWAIKRYMERFG